VNEAPTQLPRVSFLYPSKAAAAHAAIAREIADRLMRDEQRRSDQVGERAFDRFVANVKARIELKP
jgi:hypothetical protein